MEQIISMITDVGFPIAISVYLLYERDKRTKEMTAVLYELKACIEGLGGK